MMLLAFHYLHLSMFPGFYLVENKNTVALLEMVLNCCMPLLRYFNANFPKSQPKL